MSSNDSAVIIGALIGAFIGSIGTSFLNDWLKRKSKKSSLRENLVRRYLLQLQDAAQSLWYRLDNIKNKGGRTIMQGLYYEESTLYALACVLAYDRILMLDGIYSQIQRVVPGLGTFLEEKLQCIESEIDSIQFRVPFYRYNRLVLAESVMEKGDSYLRVSNYLEFKQRYEDSNTHIRDFLQPAKEYISFLKGPEVSKIMEELNNIAARIGEETGIPSKITSQK